MIASNIIVCELKGSKNSNPFILGSYPVEIKDKKSIDMIPKFLPFGSKPGDFLINKYENNTILTYIFAIKNIDERDDLMSLSVIVEKKEQIEVYKPVLIAIIDNLSENQLLTEETLNKNLYIIFKGIYGECDIEINSVEIKIGEIFENARSLDMKKKPKIRGSFSL